MSPAPTPQSPNRLPAVTPAVRQRLQQVFEHGKKSFEKGDVDYAHDMFTQCVSEDPANLIYLQHFRANLAKRAGDTKKSGRFGGLNMKLKSARAGIAKATAKGDWQAAFASGCEALKQSPADIQTLLELADTCGTLGAGESQLYYLKWALDIDAKHEMANRKAAEVLERNGQFDQAIGCLKRVQEAKPLDQAVAKKISHLSVEQTIHKGGYNQDLLKKGDAAHAQPNEGASKSIESSAAASVTEAEPATSDPAGKSAEEELLDAIRLHPAELQNYTDLADLYSQASRLRDAERVLTKALAASGGGEVAIRERLEETRIRRMREQLEVAERRAATEKTAESVELAKRMRGQANQVELEVYLARTQRNPGNAANQFELGVRLKRGGKFREAIQAFQAARSDTRRLSETQLQLGECFQQIEQYRLAMSSYEAAVTAAPDPASDEHKLARYRAGVLATGLKEWDKAEKHLTELAAADFGYRDVADRLDKLAQNRNT